MDYDTLYREGVIIKDFRDDINRISEIYHGNKIYKITLERGECTENLLLNRCCVNLEKYESLTDKINALKVFENNIKIENCKKYIRENNLNPFASKMTQVKKEMASYIKQNKNLLGQ